VGRAIEVCLAVVALMLLGYAHAQPAGLLGNEGSIGRAGRPKNNGVLEE